MKKSILYLLVVCLLAVVLPGLAKQEQFTTEDGFVYTLDDGEINITGYTGTAAVLEIPQAIEGYPVTEIGNEAFYKNSYLVSVTLPDSVIRLGYYAFGYCPMLEIIYIGARVERVGHDLVVGCQKLEWIHVSPENDCLGQIDGVLYRKEDKTLLAYPAGKKDTNYVIPDGTAVIAAYAFLACSYLENVVVPDSGTIIANCAFWYCENLKNVNIPASVEFIGEDAFGQDAYFNPSLVILTVERDSYAAQWAEENGIPYQYADADDWLNN